MKVYKLSLEKEYGLKGGTLECILGECPFNEENLNWKRPAVLVVPGGAYMIASKTEAEPISSYFLAKGFQTFILYYANRPEGVMYPEQLLEVGCSVDYIKRHAEELNVNKDEVFVVGFSAGGHLTGNLAVDYHSVSQKMGKEIDAKPTAVGLCYPVISSKAGHIDSFNNLLYGYSQEEKEKLLQTLDLDKAVTDKTAPAFIWTVATDTCVPPKNSLTFAMALSERKIPFELHVYPEGSHGMTACNREMCQDAKFLDKNAKWLDDCASFFRIFTTEKL